MTDNIMDEISEDLRRQQLEQFWKENASWIIGGVILAVVFTAGLTWWRSYTHERNLTQTSQLIEIINESDVQKLIAFADKTSKNRAVVARFAAASIHAKRQQPEQAVAIYNAIQGMSGVDGVYRDLARLLSVSQRLNNGDAAALHKDLAPLTKKGNPWRYSALEFEALLYARENKLKEAADALTGIITDSTAPPDVRMRASTLREFYIGAAPDTAAPAKSK